MSNITQGREAVILNGAFGGESRFAKGLKARRLGLTMAAAMLAGTALVPASAVTFDVNGVTVTVADFVGAPINGADTILNDNATLGTLRVNANTPLVFGGTLTDGTGRLAFTKAGSSTLTLTGTSTHSGNTSVTAGTLVLGSNTALSANSILGVAANGTVDLAGFNATVAGLTLSDGLITNTGLVQSVLTIDNPTNTNYGGMITGDIALVKTGAGDQTLSMDSTFTGGVTLQQGLIRIGADAALGTGALSVTGSGTLATTTTSPILNVANNINVSAGQVLTVAPGPAGAELTLNGVISGDGGIAKTRSNILILNGVNTYTGGTELNGGTLRLGNANALGTGALSVTGTTTLAQADAATSLTIANAINGTAGLTVLTPDAGQTFTLAGNINTTGAFTLGAGTGGTVALTGSNDFNAGQVRVNDGTLQINGAAALNNASLRFAGGTKFDVTDAGAVTVAGNVVLNGDISVTSAGTLELDGVVSGPGGITKTGTSTLVLTRSGNSFAGQINIDGGRLESRSGSALGNGAAAINLANGTTLAVGTAVPAGLITNTGRAINIAAGGSATIDLLGNLASFQFIDASGLSIFDGTDLTLSNTITGGTLNIVGGGRVRLQAANTLEALSIDHAAVRVQNAGALGTGQITANEAGLNFISGAAVTLNQNILVQGALVVLGTDDVTINGVLSNRSAVPGEEGFLAKNGTGTLRLTAANTIDSVRFSDGRIVVSNAAALGQNDVTTTDFVGSSRTLEAGVDGLTIANNIALTGPLAVDTAGNTLTLGGTLYNSGSLVKTGAGSLVITGANSYTGGTVVNTGTVVAGNDAAFGTGAVELGNGTTLALPTEVIGGRTLANNFTLGNATIATGTNTLTLSGVLSGAGTVAKTGIGTLLLTGDSSNIVTGFTGTFDLQEGTLRLNGSIAGDVTVQAGASLVGSGTAAGTVTLNDTSVLAPGNSPGTLTFGSLVLANGTNLNFELAGIAAVPGTDADLIVVNNNLTLDGVLNITPLAGFNVGVGNRTLITYGNLAANNGLTISNAPPVDVTYTILAGPVASGAGVVQLNVAFTGTYRWDGANQVPNGVIDGGSGTFNLVNTNFTNSDGTFNLAYGNNATDDIEFGGTAGNVDVASAINFDQMGFVTTGYVLGGVGSFNANNSAINVGGNDARINTQIVGGVLAKNGAGTLTLAGDNSFNGFDINAGTVVAASDTALGAGNVAMAAGTTLVAEGNRTLANTIGLAGSATFDAATNDLVVNGAVGDTGPLNIISTGGAGTRDGRVFLNGVNTYTAGTNVTGSTVIIGADSGLGAAGGQLTLNDAELRTTASFTSTRGITLAGAVADTINVDAGTTFTANGVVDGAQALQKIGDGTLVLGNAGNSYAGGTVINAGTVSVASNGALGALGGGVSFTGNSTLQFTANVTSARTVGIDAGVNGTIDTQANDVRLNGVISGAGSLTKIGDGRLTLTGTNTYAGGTNLNAGTLRIDDGNAIGSGLLTTQDGTTFVAGLGPNAGTITLANNIALAGGQTTIDLNGNLLIINPVTGATSTNGTRLVLNGVISGAGGFTTSALTSGQLVINSSNNFTGDVFLNSAVAVVNADNALGVGNTVNINAAAGIRNTTANTTRTIGSNIAINDPNATVGGNGNLVLTGVVSGDDTNVFNKVGLGTVTLANAANTIAAQIEVAQGELAVTGNLTNANQLTNVRAGATLSGTGSIAGIVEVANAGVLSAGVGGNGQVGQLTIGTLLLNEQSSLVFDLGDNYVLGGPLNDTVAVTNLRLGGRLTVRESAGGSFGLGVYNLFTYQGALLAGSTNVQVQTLPGAFTGLVQTLVPGQVNLIVTAPGTFVQYWDGADATGNGAVNGGTGTWSANGSNWTGLPDSQLNTNWFNNSVAVFGGTAGTVTLAQLFAAQGLQFVTDGYTLTGGILDNQSTGVGTGMFVSTGAGITATINSTIQGDGILFKQGGGTLVLGGNNGNFSGGTQVQAGTLQLNTALAAGTNSIALLGNTTLSNGGGVLTVANAITTTGANSIDSGAGSFTLTGIVSGAGSITKTGSGTLTLSGVNSYTGGTTVDAGTLAVTNNSSIGTGGLTLNGGTTFQAAAAGLSFANAVTINGAGTVDTQGNELTLTGTVSDGGISGTLIKIGSGNLNLQGTNSYSNGTNLNAGSITVFNNASIGTGTLAMADSTSLIAGANNIVLANAVTTAGNGTIATGTNTLTLNGVVSGAGSIAKTGTGTLVLNGANSYAGGTALNGGTIQVGTNTALGTGALAMAGGTTLQSGAADLSLTNAISTAGTGTIDTQANSFTLGGVISGAGSITKIGSGNLVLNGANTYSGGSSINAGTVTVGSNTALGSGLVTMADGTTLANNANNLNVANAFSIGNVTVATGANTFTMSGSIGGAGLLTKTGSGNLILTGNNSYTGGTALTAGTITFGSSTAFGTGTITTTGGTTLVAGVTDPSTGLSLNVANAIALGAGTTTLDLQGSSGIAPGATGINSFTGTNLTLGGTISGDGGFLLTDGGRLNLNGANSFAGGLNVINGVVYVGTDTALGTGTFTATGDAVLANDSGSLRTLANAFVVGSNLIVSGPNDITLNGNSSGTGTFFKTSTSTLTLNGTSTRTGSNRLFGGRITVGTNSALGTGAMQVFSTGQSTTLAAGADGLTLGNNISVDATGNLIVESGTGTFTLNGVVSGAGALTKIQSGTLVLNGAKSYTGGTTLTAGTIQVGTNTALGTNTLAMAGGTTLQSGVDNLVVANAITTAGVGTIDTQANNFTLNGVISGAGSITKIGSGNLVLNAANTYSGGSSINAGTVTVGSNSALGSGLVTMADGTTLTNNTDNLNVANNFSIGNVTVATGANTFTMSGTIGGVGLLTKTGSGNLILTGNNSYTGGTALTAGTITIGTNTALGTGTLTTTGGTILVAGTTTGTNTVLTVANDISLGVGTLGINLQGNSLNFNNDGSIVTDGASLTLNGVVSGAGTLVTGNFGTLTLNGANSYTGGTQINGRSVVYVGSDTAVGTGTVTMGAATGLYNFSGSTRTLANAFVLNGGSWLGGANDLVLNGTFSGAGTLIKAGAATLVLNGNNSSFSGSSQLRDGRITVGTSTALGSGTLTVFAPVVAPVAGLATTLAAGTTGLALANNVVLSTGSNLIVESGTGTFTLNGVVSGAGALTKIQSGTLVLNGANTYTGGTTLTAGTIQVGNNTALGTNTLAMAGGTTLQSGVNNLVVANAITTAGVGTIDTQANSFTLNGVISGAGSIAKIGSGNLILNGANTYAGGTALNAGTITVGTNTALGSGRLTAADGTSLVAGVSGLNLANLITLNGGLTVDPSTGTLQLSGNIDGVGGLTKVNTGTLILSGNNSFAGGVNLNSGTIQVNSNGALGTGGLIMADGTTLLAGADNLVLANAITTLGNGTVNTQAFTFTLNGVIGGAGSITKTGTGNLVLNGLNTYTGGTALNAGTITVATNSALGTGTLTMAAGTTLTSATNVASGSNTQNVILGNAITGTGTFATADNLTLILTGPISGTSYTKTGNGLLVLNGTNSFTDGLALTAGTVRTGSNSALGTGTLTTSAGTTLQNGVSGVTLANAIAVGGALTIDTQAFGYTLNGVISGTGPITKIGSANLTLGGANTYTGGTTISAGTVTVGTSTALGTGAVTMADGTTLANSANDLNLANNVSIGNVTVATGTNNFTLSGVVSGAGTLTKTGTGNLVLNGLNTYTGGTALNAGTITVATDSALGTGTLTMAAGTTLTSAVNVASGSNTQNVTLGNAITGTGTFAVANDLTLILNGTVSGTGYTKSGGGLLVLNGTNSFTGGLALTSGTVRTGSNSALGTGTLTTSAGTTLQNGVSGVTLANAIAVGGALTIDTQAFGYTLNGVISGTGPITKIGSATLTLNGANTYTGGTALNAGTIRIGANTALGTGGLAMAAGTTLQAGAAGLTAANAISMAGGATVDVNGNVLTLGGVISGTGPLSVIDSQSLTTDALILTGTNTYTGGTVVTGTTVQVAADANLGNTSGGITLVGGTLRTTASFSTARTVALGTGGGTIETATGTTLTTTGVVSGTSLTKSGAGTLVLNGANTYTGGTALTAGQITVGTNSALGTGTLTMTGGTTLAAGVTGLTTANAIVTLGAATINSGATPATYTISGVISGAGSVTKQGTGVLTVSAANTYTGATTVAAGTLNVTGSLVSAVTVNSAAALTGNGTVGALNVLAGGSVNPGAPGSTDTATLTVTGAATLGGTYTVNLTPSANDRINAGGVLTLGGTLAATPVVPGAFTNFNQTFTVATGASRTGTFATVTGLDQFGIAFNPVVEYTATAANIRLAPQSLVTLGNRFGGISGNQLEVANAFDRAVAAGYNPQAFFNVYANGGSSLPRTLREMSGEQRATERRVVLDSNRTIREAALDRLNNGIASMGGQQVSKSDGENSLTFWLRGAGSWGKAQTNGAATAFTTEQRGVLTGLDWKANGLTVGGMFHYTSTNVEYRVLGGSSNVETVGGTVYAGYRKDGGLVVNAGGTVAGSRSNGARAITLQSFAQSLQGRTNGTTYQVFGELAWDLAGAADTRIEPFARLSYVKADFGGLVETGGVAALTAAKQGSNVTVTNLGMRFGANVASGKVALNASASWQGTSGDRDALTVIGIPAVGQNGNIRSVQMDRSALNLTADAGVNLSDAIRFSLGYSGLVGKRNDDHGARATLNFAF
jgi:autotransporter-associated beta strand protein